MTRTSARPDAPAVATTCPTCGGPTLGIDRQKDVRWCHKCQREVRPGAALVEATEVRQGALRPLSELENLFLTAWSQCAPDVELHREWRFTSEKDWQVDFAAPDVRVAVEVEGRGHDKQNMYARDVAKYNRLASLDWLLFRCTREVLETPAPFCFLVYKTILKRRRVTVGETLDGGGGGEGEDDGGRRESS